MTGQEMQQYIEFNPLRGREPIFRETNVTVSHIVDDFAKGMTFDEVLKEHPQLTTKHLQATFAFCRTAIKEADLARLTFL